MNTQTLTKQEKAIIELLRERISTELEVGHTLYDDRRFIEYLTRNVFEPFLLISIRKVKEEAYLKGVKDGHDSQRHMNVLAKISLDQTINEAKKQGAEEERKRIKNFILKNIFKYRDSWQTETKEAAKENFALFDNENYEDFIDWILNDILASLSTLESKSDKNDHIADDSKMVHCIKCTNPSVKSHHNRKAVEHKV